MDNTYPLLKETNAGRENGIPVAVVEHLHYGKWISRRSTSGEEVSEEYLFVFVLEAKRYFNPPILE